MKVMTTWVVMPGKAPEAVQRFLATQTVPAGLKLLGRWHKVGSPGGFTLWESEDLTALYREVAFWSDLLTIESYVVIEDAEAGPVLAHVFK
jgi:Protein of unknown function (DUF3303)